jgi:hypothetical protein
MRARLFKPQFAPLVKAGTKRQTIRPLPKRMPQPGEVESWRQWSGRPYCSPQIELAQVRITAVDHIQIHRSMMVVNGVIQTPKQQIGIATADGFEMPIKMAIWFELTHGLPFTGILIKAEDL